MSVRTARWLLWSALMLMLPVPFFLAETGVVPPARILMLGLVTLAIIVAEGAQGVAGLCGAFLLGQALGYAAVLWFAAFLFTHLLGRWGARHVGVVALALVVTSTVAAAGWKIYRDPFATHALRSAFPAVYE